MKKVRCGIAAFLFLLVSFSMVSCGIQKNVSTEGEKYGETANYRISKVVEKVDGTENVYEAEYDEAGRPKTFKISVDGEKDTIEFRYNGEGVLEYVVNSDLEMELPVFCDDKTIEIYAKADNGEIELLAEYQYNEANRIVLQRTYYILGGRAGAKEDDDLYFDERLYSYNSEGDILDYKEVDRYEICNVWEYENIYGEHKKLEEAKITKLIDMGAFEKYTYDKKGNVISKTIGNLSDGGKVFGEIRTELIRYEWTYDDAGNILTEALYDVYDEEYTYKREYTYISCEAPSNEDAHWIALFDITVLFPCDGWWDINPKKMEWLW